VGAPITALFTEKLFVDPALIRWSLVTVSVIFGPLVVAMMIWVGRHVRKLDHAPVGGVAA